MKRTTLLFASLLSLAIALPVLLLTLADVTKALTPALTENRRPEPDAQAQSNAVSSPPSESSRARAGRQRPQQVAAGPRLSQSDNLMPAEAQTSLSHAPRAAAAITYMPADSNSDSEASAFAVPSLLEPLQAGTVSACNGPNCLVHFDEAPAGIDASNRYAQIKFQPALHVTFPVTIWRDNCNAGQGCSQSHTFPNSIVAGEPGTTEGLIVSFPRPVNNLKFFIGSVDDSTNPNNTIKNIALINYTRDNGSTGSFPIPSQGYFVLLPVDFGARGITRVKSVSVTVDDTAGLSYDTFSFNLILPGTPTGLTASVVNQTATLNWNASSDAQQYQVKRSTTSGGPYQVIATTSNTNYRDDFLVPGTTYFYVVTAVNDAGPSGNSNQVTAVPVLPVPQNLRAKVAYDQIELFWDPSPGASSYVVKRSFTRGGPYTPVGNTSGATFFTDPSLEQDKEYFYVVTARGGTVETAPSNEASGHTPLPCGGKTIDKPPVYDFNSGGWSGRATFTERDGLVITDIRLNGRFMAKMVSSPYFNIKTSLMPAVKRGEFTPNTDTGQMRVRLVKFEPVPVVGDGHGKGDGLDIQAEYAIDRLTPGSQACMRVEQSYFFVASIPGDRCEPSATVSCARFYPRTRYVFSSGSPIETLQSFNVAQRMHMTINGLPGNGVGLFHDCDKVLNTRPGQVPIGCGNEGLIFDRKWNPLRQEFWAPAFIHGVDTKIVDNIHQTYKYRINEPGFDLIDGTVSPAGCPECFHMHWRWSANVPDVGSFRVFGGGRPIIGEAEKFFKFKVVPDQDLDIAVVRYKPGEEHPNNFKDLLSLPREFIVTPVTIPEPYTMPNGQVFMIDRKVELPQEVVFWYSPTSHEPNTDLFNLHGGWFNPSSPNEPSMAVPRTRPPSGAQLSSFMTSSSPDAPTNLIYGYLYQPGTTTYAFLDASTVGTLPPGYTIYNNDVFDISTEALVSGPHTISFNVPSVSGDRALFDSLRVLRAEADPFDPERTIWVDITVLAPNSPAPNFEARTITARAEDFGKFLIARRGPVNISPPGSADLAIAMQDNATQITAGNNLTYTITVTNNGPQAATNVRLVDNPSPDTVFVSVTSSQGQCRFNDEAGAVYCQLSTINAGASATVTLVTRADENNTVFPPEGKVVENSAQVVAYETDSNPANNSASEAATVTPSGNAAPSVEIVSPATDSTFQGPLNLSIRALASDPDGTVAQVNFYDGETLIGAGSPAGGNQYRVAWNNVGFGHHNLTAIVTDNGGRKIESTPVVLQVNGPVNISLTSPAAGSVIAPGSNVTVTADASNPSGGISKVEFFANTISLGTATSAPYSISWPNVVRGNYILLARATDNNGIISDSAPVQVSVTNPRSVTITSPQTGTTFASKSNIDITASVQDTAGLVQDVDFYANGEPIGSGVKNASGQYTFTWLTAPDGIHSLTAVARDSFNVTTISPNVDVAVNIPNFNPGEFVWFDDDLPRGARPFGVRDSWFWVDANPASFSGARAHQSLTADFFHQHGFDGATLRMPVNAGDKLYTYVFLHPGYRPQEIMLEWKDDNNWEHRAYWSDSSQSRINFGDEGTVSRRRIGALPPEGQWVRLEVPAEAVGLNGRIVNGISFILYGGRATFDRAGKTSLPTPPQPQPEDTVWFDDELPAGAITGQTNDHWSFVTSPVFSGAKAHQTFFGAPGDNVQFRSHNFTGATAKLNINPGDVLFTYVFIDENFKPDQIILEWHDGTSFNHRAYWGASYAVPGTGLGNEAMRYMGPLPKANQWVRLEVPASYVGLEGKTVSGQNFGMFRQAGRGLVTWDLSGKSTKPVSTSIEPLHATIPIYRFFHSALGYFYFTNSKWGEGLQSEVPAWYVHANQAAGTVPFYRYKSIANRFFYTMRAPDSQGFLPGGTIWKIDTAGGGDGIAFYIYPNASTPGTTALHLFRGPLDYFYSTDRFDRAAAGMTYEGIMGYVNFARSTISPTLNPIDEPEFFVRQHYLDFLDREPDASGLAFWVNDYNNCPTSDLGCIEVKRINISAAFFLSIEFQQTGYFAYRYHMASFGNMPRMTALFADKRTIAQGIVVGAPGWEQALNANKDAFARDWVERAEFKAIYDQKTNEQFVDDLYANAGVAPASATRDALVGGLNAHSLSRADAMRQIVDDQNFVNKEVNPAFVLMQYFGYLRRNPDDSPDNDLRGFNFWLGKLNQFNGNFVNAEMVKAFLSSTEYRQRFGQPTAATAVAVLTSGANVSAKSGVLTAEFMSVSSSGTMKVASSYPWSLGPPPEGYEFYKGLAWQVSSTASVSLPATMSVTIPWEVKDPAEFAALRVLSREGDVWVDRTILAPGAPAPNFATRTISARINALSTIAIARQGSSSAPTLSITSPTAGAVFNAQASVNIAASAYDPNLVISKVLFYDGETLLGEDSSAPYGFAWTASEQGAHQLSARAVDSLGTNLASSTVTVTVNSPPAVTISAPADGATFDYPGSITINAAGSDLNGITKIEFYQGTTKLGEDTTAPYSFTWNNVPIGTYSLTAKAIDGSNLTTTSPAATVTVRNLPPGVAITSPANGAVIGDAPASIPINASAEDFNGVAKVEFFQGATKLGEDLTAPYSFTWSNVPAGSYSLTAKATDTLGVATTSRAVSVTVGNAAPTVSITSPATGSVYNAPAGITIAATAADNEGIKKVEFFNGATKLGEDTTAPYSFTWSNVPAGSYSLTAKAWDNLDAVTTSAAVNVNVIGTITVFSDDFNDNRLDSTKWRYNNVASVSTVFEQNQRIEIPLPPNTAGYYGVQTLGTHDLREKTVSVDFVQAPSMGGWAEAYFQIKRDEANYYHMSVGAGSFVCDAWTNGVRDRTVLSYDATVGRVWRFRHDAASNTMNFETSADGAVWRTHKTVAVGFSLDSMYAVMIGGAWGTGNGAPGAAIFDNFIIRSSSTNNPPAVTLTKPVHNATFGRGSTITLAATASDADGPIQRVEFYEGPNKLGEDTTEPYTFQWSNVKYGNYFITAKAVDSAGSITTSSGANIAVSKSTSVEALLVVADAVNLPASDGVIKARLESLGFTVTVKDAVSAASSDATNKSLVFISETVASTNVTTKFRDVAVPVISAESQLFDDMQMTGPTNETDFGYAGGQTQAIIQVPSHPLAAGCTGTVTISTLASGAAWGRPSASAAQVASMSYDSTKKAIFAYESGAMMVGMQAPARRVGLIHGNDMFNSLTPTGGALFDAAVRWATTLPPSVQFPYNNSAPAAIPGTVQVELYDEGGDGTSYHDLTPGNDASNNYRYPTDVDAWDGGIGYVQAGEWLKYTVNVNASGFYRADARVAAGSAGGSFHIEFDGQDKTGSMVVPNTGGWGTYQTISKDSIYLDAGPHVMRIVMDANGSNGFVANFDSVNFVTGTSDLVAYWRLDEGLGSSASDSAGGNGGTLQGPTWFTGRVGSGALNFDGVDDRVSISATPALTAVANNFTVSFWAYPRSAHEIDAEGYNWGGTSGQRYAFQPAHGSGSDAGAGISIGTNGVSVYEHGDGYMPAQLVYQGQLTGWTQITLVYENKQPRLYINGALVRTGLVSQRASVLLHPQDIGGMVYGYYDGLLDEIRVYNRALNSAEVSALATSVGGSPATDYSGAQNPNGAWSYGYRPSAGAPFKLYPNVSGAGAGAGSWYDAAISDYWNLPTVAHSAGSPLIHMHPGPQGQQTILRWTAPTAAVVNVSGRYENMNNATTDVHVVHNSTNALFDGAINGQGSVAPFSVRKTVAAGDTIDFVVGWGSNGTYNSDSTGLALNLTTEPIRNQSAFVSQSVPTSVDAGSRGPVSVTFRNTGTTTWSSAGNYNLGSQNPQDNTTWGMARVALPATVPPGGQVTFNFNATAPSTPATYAFQWRMVQDTVEWFGDYSTSANVAVSELLPTMPAADWSFDEGGGTTAADATGNGNTGTLVNGAAWVTGRNGAGLAFDGVDDYVQVGSRPGLTVSNTLTVGAWIYPTGTSSAGLGLIVNKEGEYEIARFGDGTIQWAVANSAPGWNFVNTGFVAPLNQWTHIALTYDRGTVKTYANGNLVHTYSGSGAIGDVSTSQNDLRIGGRQCCAQFFMGRMDEVSVYNQALDAAAVRQLWQGQAPRNLSLGRAATQSSDGFGGVAGRAVDGNTDGIWANNSVTHTTLENQPWWQVDLGAVQSIAGVRLWNRTDCCAERLSSFYVLVSDAPFTSNDLTTTLNQAGVSAYLVSGQAWLPLTVGVNRTGRYVRIHLRGASAYLSLAEVQVFGAPGMVPPGVIQAENFNNGPEGVAYHDTDVGNNGGAYRQTDVDIASGYGTGYCIGWTAAGEWLDYSINVLQTGAYNLESSVAMPSDTGRFHVEIDGVNVTGSLAVPNTGGYNTWQTLVKPGIQLTAGRHTMRVVMESSFVANFDYFKLVPAQ